MELGGSVARYINCKKGLHSYSPVGNIGGGIARRSCSACGVVQIDLSDGSALHDANLFSEPKLATMFTVEALLAKVTEAPVLPGRSFGEAPLGRRRPARATG
jgi:hypothetical protein